MAKSKQSPSKSKKSDLFKSKNEDEQFQSIDLNKFDVVEGNSKSKLPELKRDIPKENVSEIKNLISEVKHSNKQITETAKQCIDFIQSSEKGIDYINDHSSFFGRIAGAITGKTGRISLKKDQDLANAQRCCVQLINEMNKEMLFSQTQILMLVHLVNDIIVERDEFRQELKTRLENILKAVKKRFEIIERTIYGLSLTIADTRELVNELEKKLGKKIEHLWNKSVYLEDYILKVERQVETLEWIELLGAYDNIYDQLKENKILLFLQLVFDFYKHKKGNFSYKDLLLFSCALRKLGFVVEESMTMKKFIDKYIEALTPDERYKEVDKFLEFKPRTQDEIVKVFEEGYYSIGTIKTKFVTALNVTNYIIVENLRNEKSTEDIKRELDTFRDKSGLYFDKPFDWFLIACEILSYRTIASKPSGEVSNIKPNEIHKIIENGKKGNYYIKQDIQKLFLDEVLLKLTKELSSTAYTDNFIGLKKFLASDPSTLVSYGELADAIQFEVEFGEKITLGIYASSDRKKLIIICGYSIGEDYHPDLVIKLRKKYDKMRIKDFCQGYYTIGFQEELSGDEENLDKLPSRLADNFMELLKIISSN